jgi:hypothetical protein
MKIVDSDIRLQQIMGVPKLETPSRQGVFARVLGGVPSLTRGNGGMEMAWQGVDLFQAQPLISFP